MGNRELENTIRINLVIVHSNVESITEPREVGSARRSSIFHRLWVFIAAHSTE